MTVGIRGLDHFAGGSEPFPTIYEAGSGRIRAIKVRTIAEMIDNSQNIQAPAPISFVCENASNEGSETGSRCAAIYFRRTTRR